MIDNTRDTAILIFSKTEKEEAVSKQFLAVKDKKKNQKVARVLIEKALQTVQKSNIPYFFFNATMQKGVDFSEKISNAIQYIFNKGYQNVITVGNDCPALSVDDILTSSLNFKNEKITIGPAIDGGIYLLALDKKSFCAEQFQRLNWQSETLYSELESYFSKRLSIVQTLDVKGDIDSFYDLKTYLSNNQGSSVSIEIEKIIVAIICTFSIAKVINLFTSYSGLSQSLRAPPIAA